MARGHGEVEKRRIEATESRGGGETEIHIIEETFASSELQIRYHCSRAALKAA